MAQKREKEETELKVPESLPLCTPTITVSPSPPPQLSGTATTDDSRSNSARLPESSDLNLSGTADDSRSGGGWVSNRLSERSDLVYSSHPHPVDKDQQVEDKKVAVAVVMSLNRSLKRPRDANRCSGAGCRRKLGLMGFRCRCGDMFCSEHRYSDRHDCSYDYKAAGREAIARENPVVKAAKILKV